ncbi:MAG: tyrosine-type recombinase/integrase [Prevotella koreensis]|uniref:tyrosine-type recombinase/integrase n=1 Tax=Prevotella koreensis TaxID=2490854 RepID=UPI003FA110B2
MFPKTEHDNDIIKRSPIVDFIPPQRHDGAQSYVWFSQVDPMTGKLKRKKYMLDRFKPGKVRDIVANRIIANIYNKVLHGWNVWAPTNTSRSDSAVGDVLDRYHAYIINVNRKGVIKQKTFYDYTSRLRVLVEYINEQVTPIRMCYQMDQAFWGDFFDYLLIDRDLSAKTRNNYRTWASALCSWLVDKRYLNENPIQYIHQLPEHEKFRQPLDPDDLRKLSKWLQSNNKPFLLAVMMEYFTAIRPTELSFIKLKDINISEGSIFVSSQISKNRRDGKIKLPNKVIKLMIELGVFKHKNECYLFGSGFLPSEKRQDARYFTKEFNKVREELGFPKNYMFYSLKDSGLRDISNAVGVEVAQKQARHSSIQTTNLYLQGRGMKVFDVLSEFEGYL